MVFALSQIQEKRREQNKGLFITFIYLAKTFDTVSRNGLWKILRKPPKFLAMVIQLHGDHLGQAKHGNIISRPFKITNGVKHGCGLAPTLFTLFFSMMLQHVTYSFSYRRQPVQPKIFASPHEHQREIDQGAFVR